MADETEKDLPRGAIGEFFPNKEEWIYYQERLEICFETYGVSSEQKKRVNLLNSIGADNYKLVRDLATPDAPKNKKYDDLCGLLKSYYAQPTVTFKERKIFYGIQRDSTESAVEYMARIKRAASNCEFGNKLEDIVMDKFVISTSGRVFEKLCEEDIKTLTLKKVLDTAIKCEAQTEKVEVNAIHQYREKKQFQRNINLNNKMVSRTSGEKEAKCERCGYKNHTSGNCKFKLAVCNRCNRTGHIAPVCKVKKINCVSGEKVADANYLSSLGNSEIREIKDQIGNLSRTIAKISSNGSGGGISVINNCISEYDLVESNNNCSNALAGDSKNNYSQIQKESLHEYTENQNILTINKIKSNNAIYINVKINDKVIKFLLDSGACASLIPLELYKKNFNNLKISDSDIKLCAYSGHEIKVVGEFVPEVTYGSKTSDFPMLVVADGQIPIMGRDFLSKFQIVFQQINNINSRQSSLEDILGRHEDLFNGGLGKFRHHQIRLDIKENVTPVFFKPRQIAYAFKNGVEDELSKLEEQGVITPVATSEWGTPLVPVLKADGSIRLCADYRVTLNKHLIDNRHPLPRIEDVFHCLQGGEQFSKLDMAAAYNQFELDDESRKLVAWSTHRGVYLVNRLPFGVKPATGIFQREAEKLLLGIPGVVNFLDDIVVTGRNRQEHLDNLARVFQRLSDAGLKLRKDKCEFFRDKINYLGHVVTKEGLSKSNERIQAIVDSKIPSDISEVRAFCGLVNYYAKFLPNLAQKMYPIYEILKKDKQFNWNDNCQKAFDDLKGEIVSDVVLIHFNPELPIVLTTDASSYGISGVISHVMQDGQERPVAFCSRTLTNAEKNYSVIEKEGLAVVFSVFRFYQYLIGHNFVIKTDHKPLLGLFGESKGFPQMAANRIQRWAVNLSVFRYTIEYVKGKSNVADAFSRLPLTFEKESPREKNYINFIQDKSIFIDQELIKTETEKDDILKKVYSAVKENNFSKCRGDIYQPYLRRKGELAIESGIVLWGHRIVIPKMLQGRMLASIHASHFGIVKSKSIARSYMWWPNMDSELEQLIKSCTACLSLRSEPPKSELISWENTRRIWSRIHMDYAGPINNNYYFVVTDSFSKWVEVFRTKEITAVFTVSKLRETFARFGLPDVIVSDCGTQFVSEYFSEFTKLNGIQFISIPPGHPASNGAAENAVRSFKKGLISALTHARQNNESVNTDIIVQRYLFDYRIATHCSTGSSPASVMFNRPIKTRFDLMLPRKILEGKRPVNEQVSEQIDRSLAKQKENFKNNRQVEFEINEKVMVRDYTNPNKKGWRLATIVKVLGERTFLCELESLRRIKRHTDQIIKANLSGTCSKDKPECEQKSERDQKIVDVRVKYKMNEDTVEKPSENHVSKLSDIGSSTGGDNSQVSSDDEFLGFPELGSDVRESSRPVRHKKKPIKLQENVVKIKRKL